MIILGVGITVLAVLIVGIAVARKIDGDSANYLVAGRRLGVPLVAVSLTAAAVDSNATVGNTDLTSQFGFWAGASLAIGLAICLLLAGLFLAKPMNRMKLFTLGDFFRIRYSRPMEVIASILMIISFTIAARGQPRRVRFPARAIREHPLRVGRHPVGRTRALLHDRGRLVLRRIHGRDPDDDHGRRRDRTPHLGRPSRSASSSPRAWDPSTSAS